MQLLLFLFTWQCSAALLQECSQGAGANSDVIVDDGLGAPSNLMMLQVRSTEKRPEAAKVEDFHTLGPGCCSGYRDEVRGKLWADETATFEACAAKCREFENCGFVEYGWLWNPKWCYIWSDEQPCEFLDTGGYGKCGGGGSDGVKTYVFQKNLNFLNNMNQQMIMQETVEGDSKPKESKENIASETAAKDHAKNTKSKKEKRIKKTTGADQAADGHATAEAGVGAENNSRDASAATQQKDAKEDADDTPMTEEAVEIAAKKDASETDSVFPDDLEANEKEDADDKPMTEEAVEIAAKKDASETVSAEEDSQAEKKDNEADPDDLDFEAVGAGCCRGARDVANGKLWGSALPDLSACKAQCRATPNCGFIEYGWSGHSADHKFCFIWSKQQKCSVLDSGSDKCGPAGSDGVHAYKFKLSLQAQLADIDDARDFDTVGSGCCPGARHTSDGKLWAGSQPNLAACKAKCREYGTSCGAVEYGWNGASSNHQFCFVWSKQQACASVEKGPGKCGPAGSDGVQAYRMKNQTSIRAGDSEDAAMLNEDQLEDVSEHMTKHKKHGWEDVGAGCCKGVGGNLEIIRGAPELSICKEMCLEHSNCGAVEWAEGDPAAGDESTCVIWGDTEECLELVRGDGCSAHDAFHSVRTHKLRRRDPAWQVKQPKIDQ